MRAFKLASALAASTLASTSAFAQQAAQRASTSLDDASQFGGDSTILLILAILAIGVGIALLVGNDDDTPSSP